MDTLSTSESSVNTRTGFVRDRFTWERTVGESDLPLSVKCVAYVIAMHAGPFDDKVWPSVARIAKLSGASRSTVQRSLGLLVERGFVAVIPRDGSSNLYEMRVPHSEAPPAPQRGTRVPQGGAQNMQVEQTKETPLHQHLMSAICEWMERSPSGGEGGQWGRVAKLMALQAIEPSDVLRRGRNYDSYGWDRSPMGLWNHWGKFDRPKVGAIDDERILAELRSRA